MYKISIVLEIWNKKYVWNGESKLFFLNKRVY